MLSAKVTGYKSSKRESSALGMLPANFDAEAAFANLRGVSDFSLEVLA